MTQKPFPEQLSEKTCWCPFTAFSECVGVRVGRGSVLPDSSVTEHPLAVPSPRSLAVILYSCQLKGNKVWLMVTMMLEVEDREK